MIPRFKPRLSFQRVIEDFFFPHNKSNIKLFEQKILQII